MTSSPRVLIDSDAIFAIAVKTDAHHEKALTLQEIATRSKIFISDFVFGEAVNLLSRRVSKNLADSYIREFSEGNMYMIVATEKIIATAQDFFLRQITKDTSFVDCVNMAVAKRLGIDTIFSFDRAYERNGFKLLAPQ